MTETDGFVARTVDRAALMYGRLAWGLEALLPLFELSICVLVSTERK